MGNRALIVGIANYGDRVPGLVSPDTEIQEWRDLLVDTYGFEPPEIRLLANERATKEELVNRLEWLFDGAAKGDKRVFIYSGHGIQLPERDELSGELLDHMDEALLTYPPPGADLAKVALYDNDLLGLYQKAAVPSDAKTTFILDCCFGGGINLRDVPFRPTAMSVTPPIDLEHRTMGWRQPQSRWTDMPVFVSAAGELNLAVEIDVGGKRRSLFGYHAISALRAEPEITYRDLLDKIREPMRTYFAQYPNVRGDWNRLNDKFLN